MVAARVVSVPALVVATYRDDEVDRSQQLQFILGELVGRRGRLKIEPLSRSAVAALCQPLGVDDEELHRQTGGNPFFVSEVLATVGERIPETVRDAVLSRAKRLSKPARQLLDALSVVPGEVDMPLAEALGGTWVDDLDECLSAGMLRSHGVCVSFRHELARLAIEEAISPQRRVALHRIALMALSDPSRDATDFARLVHHAQCAGDVDGVLRWAPLAAQRASSSGAHREAAAHYATALCHAARLPTEQRADLLARCAQENVLCAQSEDAIVAFQQALRCRQHGCRSYNPIYPAPAPDSHHKTRAGSLTHPARLRRGTPHRPPEQNSRQLLCRRRRERQHEPRWVCCIAVDLVRDRPANRQVEGVRR